MECKRLSFAYGDRPVFRDMDLEIPDGGITVLTGENGCGKTTLLRLLAGLEMPDAGEIDAGPADFLFQEDRLLPRLTARGQITAVLGSRTDPRPYLRAVGLEDRADEPTSALSGGMRRRLALARTLGFAEARDRRILLLDEPFAGVDPDRIGSLISVLRKTGKTVLIVSHEPLPEGAADRVVRLDRSVTHV